MQPTAATANNTISAAEVGRRLANGEQGQELAKELGISEATFSRANASYLKAYISQLKTEAEQAKAETVKAKQTASQLQGTKEGLQKSCERLQVELNQLQQSATNLQAKGEQLQVTETNLHEVTRRLQVSETNLHEVTSQLQANASRLQIVETERETIAANLQVIETERDRLATELQAVTVERDGLAIRLQKKVSLIFEQRLLTHPRFLLAAIVSFEFYNGWQLHENMVLQQFPYIMSVAFSVAFGLASVTALVANIRWGVWFCVASAFASNAIHAKIFDTAFTWQGVFYTLLPCVLIYMFADMYKNKNIF